MNHIIMHRLSFRLHFPQGVSPGEGRASNLLAIARDGQNRPVLRGSALAGALRHAFCLMQNCGAHDIPVTDWFGVALDSSLQDSPSRIQIADSLLETGKSGATVRTHISIDRHRGSVRDHSLFSLQTLPPGTSAPVVLWIEEMSDKVEQDGANTDEGRRFSEEIASILRAGILLGGNTSRGIGRGVADDTVFYRCFRCSELSDHADYLDERYAWQNGENLLRGEQLTVSRNSGKATLQIQAKLVIPQGQDLLIADGTALDYAAEPQRVVKADGESHWKIPGSAFRGPFRSWITRLAARSGHPVSDSLARHRNSPQAISGDDIAWDFASVDAREKKVRSLANDPNTLEQEVSCPVLRLFGSGYSKGRIHIADLLAAKPMELDEEQSRAHVAVDRITGGAREGAFFKNRVLLPGETFELFITIQAPTEEEARWINSTLMAMHHGIIRIGSSKASGFFQLVKPAKADGPFSGKITTINHTEETQ